jgi:hypothetical protein
MVQGVRSGRFKVADPQLWRHNALTAFDAQTETLTPEGLSTIPIPLLRRFFDQTT